ncbi:T9SS type B sorting domain-containing protein [Flavobacterium supellecticarium]|uniref:T9SS type B sorting domain-containing protein n=1 Tax=Flavobacterium supellecticarium TaxID=2565924 RepID=A0A4S3ZPA1_9FLAO|nr:choice-of-anchor L domain-containing protein [Flavobacterium supellecticarium]THF47323.1 T9SS type B sorting domain-containing protein [Flavobacterium supellecticarium]
MKKITLLIFMSLLSFVGFSQVFPEGFEGTAFPPTGPGGTWVISHNGIGMGPANANLWIRTPLNSTTSPPHTGNYAAMVERVNIGNSNTEEDWLISPLVTAPANGQLRFYAQHGRAGDQGSKLQIRVSTTSQTDLSTFTTQIIELSETAISPTPGTYVEQVVNFNNLVPANQQIYIAFVRVHTQNGASADGDRFLIDDINLVQQCLDPANGVAGTITTNSAQLSWDNPSGSTQWEIELIPSADPLTGVGQVINSNPYTATTTSTGTPIAPGTVYQYKVRSICTGGIPSNWVGPFYFTTVSLGQTCAAPIMINSLPYSTTDDTANYGNHISGNQGATGCGATGNYLTGNDVVYAYTATFTGMIDISMTPTATYSGIFVYDNCANIGTSCLAGVGNSNSNIRNIPNFPVTAGTTYYFLISTNASPQTTAYTLVIQQVNCPPPTALAVGTLNMTSADLTWGNPSGATEWQVVVQTSGSGIPAGAGTTVTVLPFNATTTFAGAALTAGSNYEYYVRAKCPDGSYSQWSGPKLFQLPLCNNACNFSFVMTDSYGDGWNGNTIDIRQNGVIIATLTGPTATDGTNPITVQVPLCSGIPYEVYWNPDGSYPTEVGLTVITPFGVTAYTKPPGTGSQDSLLFTGPTDCVPPTCPQPTALTASGATANSIQAAWTEAGTATTWEVIALPAGSPSPNTTPPTSGIITVTTNPNHVIGSLSSDTNYDIYVRAVCSPTDSSYWTGPATKRTLPDYCAGDHFYDSGGATGNYSNNSNITTTICPANPGDIVTIEFNEFNIENQFDFLTVYDGSSATGTPIGTFTGNLNGNLPGPFESSVPGGCITFVFESDGIVTASGWDATVTCGPVPTCPRPTAVTISNITQTGAMIDWTEIGSATQWEIVVIPSGDPAPGANPPGVITTSVKPYTIPEGTLTPSTSYDVFVRAICSPTDKSNWSFRKKFTTKPVNDECSAATQAPVNDTQVCTLTTPGTVVGATASTQPNACGGTADDDVWYQFTATNTRHSIKLLNLSGSTGDLYHAVYSGTCGNLTQLYCSDPETSIAENLVVGQTYYIRVYTYTSTPGQTSTFDLCVATPPPPIATNNTQYTVPQLVQDVLIGSTCAQISNITWSTGTNFGNPNGIAYFTRNGSNFPLESGIILSTGDALKAKGPNTSNLSDGTNSWPGDTQLFNYIQNLGFDPDLTIYRNATVLEFDFVPITNQLSFDFLFASEEYGTYQCDFSDAFAFFLTDSNGTTTNLALVPGTSDPISVTRIRDNAYNPGCPSINAQYFDIYNGEPNEEDASINFNGQTKVMTAQSAVTPNTTYHIKLVIADRNDTQFDSAVFLKAGSFNIGTVDLGDDLLIADGTAVCYGDSYTIDTGLNPADFTFTWSTAAGGVIPGATGPSLTVTQTGDYTVSALYNGTTCSQSDTLSVEFYDQIAANTPANMTVCDASGFATFDLTTNNSAILGTLNPADYTLTFHNSQVDADGDVNPITVPTTYTNTTQYQETIYVRVENNTTGCHTIVTFNLIVQDLTPQFTITPDLTLCSGQSGQIVVTPTNYNPADVVYSWTHDTNGPLPDTTGTITVSQSGAYTVTINHNGCSATATVNVTVNPGVQPSFNQIAPICEGSTAPGLPTTSIEGVAGTWSPATVSNTATGTYTFTPTTGQCGSPVTMTITVIPSPEPSFTAVAPICSGSVAPVLPTTSLDGYTGTWSPATVSNTATGTYTFTPNAGQCAKTTTLTVTVQEPFAFTIFGDCVANQFVLTVQTSDSNLDLSNAHFQWTNNNGTTVGNDSPTFNVSEYFSSNTPNLPAIFKVKVTSSAGCSLELPYTVEQVYCQIQKGISPNNDGLNDTFDLTGFNVEKLGIFNRYGAEVYTFGTGYTNQWFGQSKGGSELPDGTYFYVIELKGGDTKTGWVYISREK